ncbi:Methylcrotonoyl-CoA carboxylase subunit alpha, mitochondrial [Phlyctochytrium bullatum]|nr:Methylcrotonoyl-CoA carboxylase subunit alpha, mitochondrial [Phlyctochytrium bullatum]
MDKNVAKVAATTLLGLYAGSSLYDWWVVHPLFSRHVVDGQRLFKAISPPSSQLQTSTSIGCAAAGAVAAIMSGDNEWYIPSLSGLTLWLWSFFVTGPVRDRILEVQASVAMPGKEAEENSLLREYGRRQLIRASMATAVFAASLYKLVLGPNKLLSDARALRAGLMRRGYAAATSSLARKPLFDKILIANRGEIACRVMRTAKKLGIKSVAVYSEADRNAMHVAMADEAYLIGPAASAESYLRMDKIIDVAKRAGAQAIHPGYGFLSENAAFADLVAREGLVFIGPPSQAIIDMGSKSASKEIMIKAGVPVVPGYHGEEQSVEFLKNEAVKMGFPVLIKAVKGGGGKGMRIVDKVEDFEEMLESSRREAIKSFGDDKVLVEKYIVRPRHVEVQVFADQLGGAVYLFERDCSVQRRHQKILEEAPAPHLSEELRRDLGTKAVAAARAVNYVGAGTVEFILDTDTNQFYFMEMNTRLQVEHPVTEMITKTDLVEWQLEVASGNPLPKAQDDLRIHGHAFEARIYAENPEKGFLPDTGPLKHLSFPPVVEGQVRVETGVRQGDEVSVHYDPMISKLVVAGEDRTAALRVLRKALGEFEVVGLNTNIDFLKKLASHPAFVDGDVETGFIKKHEPSLFPPRPTTPALTVAHAALGLAAPTLSPRTTSSTPLSGLKDPWHLSDLVGFRVNHRGQQVIKLLDGEKEVSATVTFGPAGSLDIAVVDAEGKTTVFEGGRVLALEADGNVVADIGERRVAGRVVQEDDKLQVFFEGKKTTLGVVPDPGQVSTSGTQSAGSVKTPMPCKISAVNVAAGQEVTKGQSLIVLEAMKMEHVIKSPRDGKIKKVHYKVGDLVGEGKNLLSFEDEE